MPQKKPPVVWRCPSCGLAVELYVTIRRPPSHGCPRRRGRETVFVQETKETDA